MMWINVKKHYAEYKKPVTKGHILYDFIHMKVQNRKIYRDRKWISGCLGLGGGDDGKRGDCGDSFWDDENILKLTVMMVARIWEYTKSHWIVHFKCVNYMVCELDCNKAV